MPSPTCTVNGSATPVDVTASSSPSIALANATGVNSWFLTCIGTDETTTPAAINATLVVNGVAHTATFTALGAGTGYVFQSTVGVGPSSSQGFGRDANNVIQPSYTTTFKVNVKAANGLRVISQNETFEQNSAAGWIDEENKSIRANSAGGATSVTGSGLWHSISGVLQAAAFLGTAGQIMFTNAPGATDAAWAAASQDVVTSTTTTGVMTVTGIQGRAVASTAPTNGQVYQWNSGASQWQPGSATGALTSFGGDLSNTSTATAQYVDGLSFNATGAGHGAGGAIPVNGTGTTLNWIDDAAKIQKVGTTLLQLGQASGDFIALGASPATTGSIRFPAASINAIVATGPTTILGWDASTNVQLNAPTGSKCALAINGTNQVFVDGTNFNIAGPQNIFMTDTSGGSHSIGYGNTATGTPSNLTLVAQNAGGAGPTAGGGVGLVSGSPAGAGAIGQVAFFFGGVASSNQIVFQGATSVAGLGTIQWSNAITPLLTQSGISTQTQGTDISVTPQTSSQATNQGGGSFVVNVQVPLGTAVEAYVKVKRGGTLVAQLGPAISRTGGALFLGNVTPNNSNYVISSDVSNNTFLSVGTGGAYIDFAIGAGASSFRVENGNVSLVGNPGSYGGGTGTAFMANASVNPSSSPTAGAIFYSSGGQAFVRSATDTQGLKVGTTQCAILANNQSVTSSTTLVTITGFTVNIGASDKYNIRAAFNCSFNSGSGIQLAVTTPTGATLYWQAQGVDAIAIPFTGAVTTSGTGANLAAGGTTVLQVLWDISVQGDGTHSGTVNLQFTQTASSGTSTTILAGAMMTAVKV